jgi:hypothetical protein
VGWDDSTGGMLSCSARRLSAQRRMARRRVSIFCKVATVSVERTISSRTNSFVCPGELDDGSAGRSVEWDWAGGVSARGWVGASVFCGGCCGCSENGTAERKGRPRDM